MPHNNAELMPNTNTRSIIGIGYILCKVANNFTRKEPSNKERPPKEPSNVNMPKQRKYNRNHGIGLPREYGNVNTGIKWTIPATIFTMDGVIGMTLDNPIWEMEWRMVSP